jgi:hypothetical protein
MIKSMLCSFIYQCDKVCSCQFIINGRYNAIPNHFIKGSPLFHS